VARQQIWSDGLIADPEIQARLEGLVATLAERYPPRTPESEPTA
jgi:hypothetical protein